MGAGTAAETNVDSKFLFLQAAVKQAEAEYRLQVAAQEDLRRQLLFLEEGGNYLDLPFGEGSPIDIKSTSTADPLADQLSQREEGAVVSGFVTSKNGHHVDNSMGASSFVTKHPEIGVDVLPDSNTVSVSLKECNSATVENQSHSSWVIRTPLLVELQHDGERKESNNSGGGAAGGSKVQSYARKNRCRSSRYGNGSVYQSAMEVVEGQRPAIVRTSLQGCALSSDVEHLKDEDASCEYQTGLINITRDETFGNRNGLCCAKDKATRKDKSSEELSCEREGEIQNAKHLKVSSPCQHGISGVEGRDPESCDGKALHSASPTISNSGTSFCSSIEVLNAKQSYSVERDIQETKPENPVSSTPSVKAMNENGMNDADSKPSVFNSEGYSITSHGNIENAKAVPDSEAPNINGNPEVPLLSKLTLEGSKILHAVKSLEGPSVAYNESPLIMEVDTSRKSTAEIIQGKLEDSQSDGKLPDNVALVDAFGSNNANKIQDVVQEETSTLEACLEGNHLIQISTPKPQERLSIAPSITSKSPEVVPLCQEERSPNLIAKAEKLKTIGSAATKKANESLILHDSDALKVAEKHSAECEMRRIASEPCRRKSHWDFVLEEMAWLANDFMQERLWKTALAAQICQRVCEGKFPMNSGAVVVEKQQKKIASRIAKCVTNYWQVAESMLERERSKESQGSNLGYNIREVTVDAEKNLMSQELVKKDQDIPNEQSGTSLPLRDYALRLLRSSLSNSLKLKRISPLTPGQDTEAIEFGSTNDKQLLKENLFYNVPHGALNLYRCSVESDWAIIEAEHEQTMQDQAVPYGEEPHKGNDLGLSILEEIRSFINRSSSSGGLTRDSDEVEIFSRNLETGAGPRALIAKKKRKQIPRTVLKFSENMPGVGSSSATSDTPTAPSLHILGKRPFNSSIGAYNVSMGLIPTKRMRTAAVVARQLATGDAKSPNTNAHIMGLPYKANASTRFVNSHQEEFLGLSNASVLGEAPETDISPQGSNLGASSDVGAYNVPKTKKKKKMKHFGADFPSSSTIDAAAHPYSAEKVTDSDSTWPQESHHQYEQIKRKGDQLLQVSSNNSSSDVGLEMPGSPVSQGAAGQQPTKKLKLAKQSSDENPDGMSAIAAASISPHLTNALTTNKILRPNSARDRSRKNKVGKTLTMQASISQPGAGIPWSAIEDQAIVALVHDLGLNWELVSDVLSLNSQLKGVFRKPKDCKERYRVLLERLSTDDGDSPDDFNSTHAQSSLLSGIPKSSTRLLLQRLQGPLEEDSLRIHFERIVHIVQQDRAQRHQTKKDMQEKQEILPVHSSHANVVTHFATTSLTGGYFTPLDLCEPPPLNGDFPANAFTLQPANMGGICFPPLLAAGSGLRPSSAVAMLPNLPMGPTQSPLATTMNDPRDMQRIAGPVHPIPTEEQRARYTQMVVGRGIPQGTCPIGGNPLMAFSHLNDCPVPVLPTASNGNMMSGHGIAMALPRPEAQNVLPSGVHGMASAGLNCVLPLTQGVVMAGSGDSLAAGSFSRQPSFMRRPKEALQMVRSGQCTEEQRQMLIQELQHHAAQGNNHAAAALNNLKSTLVSTQECSPKQAYSVQQHNTLAPQAQNSSQAYMVAAARMAKERQLQQQQQQQNRAVHQQQLHQSSSIQSQTISLPHQQYLISQQQQMQPQPQQHFPQQQQQLQQQVTMPPLTLQQQPSLTLASQALQMSQSQQSQTVERIMPHSSQFKLQQQKQPTRHQQPLPQVLPSKGAKVMGRNGPLSLPSVPQHPGLSNSNLGQGMSSQHGTQTASQTPYQMQGQRMISVAGTFQLPKQSSPSQHGGSDEVEQLQEQSQDKTQAGIHASNAPATQQTKGLGLLPQTAAKQQHPQLPLQPPSSASAAQLQQQPLTSPLLSTQQQSQVPVTGIPILPHSPPPQSPQYQLRRQAQQLHSSHRKLQQRQASSNTSSQTAAPMGKTSLQQPMLAPSQVMSNSVPISFHVGTVATGASGTGIASSNVPQLPNITSTPAGTHSTLWKSGQGLTCLSAGVHNLTKSSNSSTNQLSSTQPSSAAHHANQSLAANPQKSMTAAAVSSEPINGAGIILKQDSAIDAMAGPTITTSPTLSR